jgi:hypothetical protein
MGFFYMFQQSTDTNHLIFHFISSVKLIKSWTVSIHDTSVSIHDTSKTVQQEFNVPTVLLGKLKYLLCVVSQLKLPTNSFLK